MQRTGSERFNSKRVLVIWALALLTLWIGHQVHRDVFLVADTPRLVTPRGSESTGSSSPMS